MRALSPARLQRRGSAALLCGLVLFFAGQLAVSMAIRVYWPEIHDWDYASKLKRLRVRLATRRPEQPLVLVLGSSRAALGFRPELAPSGPLADGRDPILFNFAFPTHGPVRELLCMRRLLDRGIRPDLVVIECWPPFMSKAVGDSEGEQMDPGRLEWSDPRALARYIGHPRDLYRRWLRAQVVPCYYSRYVLRYRFANEGEAPVLDRGLAQMDDLGGYLWHASLLAPSSEQLRRQAYEAAFVPLLAGLCFSDVSDRAVHQLLSLCRRQHIPAVLLYMPEASPLRRWYPPPVQALVNDYFAGLSREYGVPVIDTRTWMPDETFSDYVHLQPQGAAVYTDRFRREVLSRLLDSPGPLARR
jgi:hypothetical protein